MASRRSWAAVALTVAALAAQPMVAAAPALATDMYGKPECAVSGAYRVLPVGSTTCWVAEVTFSAAAGSAIRINAAAVVDDSAHAVNTGYRAEFDGVVHCYDASGAARYRQGAARNVWRGANPAGNYPKGVFLVPASGSYTCLMEVSQTTLSGESAQNYLLRDTYITAAVHPIGDSSGGPNYDSWDALAPDHPPYRLVAPGGTIDAGRLQWTAPAGVTTLDLTGMTNVTSCSFNSDTSAYGRPCDGHVSSGTASITVKLLVWQTVSGSTAQCAAPMTSPLTVSIDPVTHHDTVSQSGSFTLTTANPDCTRQVVVKTTATNNGPAYAYVTNANTATGVTAG